MGKRGELRIYLGAAPGVGKTYAMLGEALRRRDRGTDVVVGLVETHGRTKTAALLEGLEVVPRQELDHRGVTLTELDVDAVLARKPQVVLIDELVHTNVPGSRNPKRWQDVEELLDAGITVLTTLNVQHLESLNDVIEKITGSRQQETVPDEVEVALQRHRIGQHATDVWETRERVVVALTGGRESETVLRRAARIAKRSGSAELFALHVLRGDGLAGATAAALAGLRRLAEDVGASFHTVVGDDVPAALLDFARGVDATQLVIGTSRRSRLARSLDEGIGSRGVQDSGPIDVHMVTHDEARRGLRLPRPVSAVPVTRRAVGWGLGVVLPVLATAIGVLGSQLIDLSTDVVLFFLATVVVALVGGLGPALLAAFAGAMMLNFFLTPPVYTLTIGERENVVMLVAMVITAVLVALVVDRAARRAQQAAAAGAEAALLASFSRTVLTLPDPLPRLLERVREAFGMSTVAILERHDGQWVVSACSGPPDCGKPEQADVDVAVEPDVHLVAQGRTLRAADRRLLEAVAGQALIALRNRQIADQAAEARRRADAVELRSALLSAVGHDLRTPLTSIKAAAGSLRAADVRLSNSDRSELAATIEESADRLTGLVSNLLDSSRIATGAVTPDLRPVGYDEVAVLAMRGLDGAGRVKLEIDEHLPEVLADPGLLERVIANIVDNAVRHGRGSPVVLRASAYADLVELRVVDSGPGVRVADAERLFAPFQRLGDRDHNGLGLGLSVARGFTAAMGGTLTAEDTPGGGLTVVISLPAAQPA